MPVMKQFRIGSATYDTVGEASVTQVQTSGTKIATVTIDGTATDLYAPEGGGGGGEKSTWYGTSSDNPISYQKVVSIPDFVLENGTVVVVQATTANSSIAELTLNVGGSGHIRIYKNNAGTSPTNKLRWAAGDVLTFAYDGDHWRYCGGSSIEGAYVLPAATPSALGGVVVGDGLSVASDGTLSTVNNVSYITEPVNIPSSAWNGTTATVSSAAATASNDVIVSPAPSSIAAWAAAGVYCSAQGNNTLTFSCSTAPTDALTANVMCFDGGETIAASPTVVVSLTNPISGSDFNSCGIYGMTTEDDDNPQEIASITDPSGSATFDFDNTAYRYLLISFDTDWGVSTGTVTYTGGVAFYKSIRFPLAGKMYTVSASGSVTFDGNDYGD